MKTLLILMGLLAVVSSQANDVYRWSPRPWSSCSASCAGRGAQRRRVDCTSLSGARVSQRLCHQNTKVIKPPTSQICAQVDCPVTVTSRAGACSKSCGSGVRLPETTCNQILANGTEIKLSRTDCEQHDSGAFNNLQTCNTHHCPPEYELAEWGACSKTCGDGIQQRKVRCLVERRGRKRPVAIGHCRRHLGSKKTTRVCTNEFLCPDNFYWRPEDWSSCLVTCQRHRKVACFSKKDHAFVPDEKCKHFARPAEVERCINSGIYSWRVGEYGDCSKTCGGGTRMRQVYCVNAVTNEPAKSCPLCLKPTDQIKCAQRSCHSASSFASCTVEPEGTTCHLLKVLNLCRLDVENACCSCKSGNETPLPNFLPEFDTTTP